MVLLSPWPLQLSNYLSYFGLGNTTMPTALGNLLSDTPGDRLAQFTTDAAAVKPFLFAANQLVSEARLRIDGDGWNITASDPANVAAVDVSLYDVGDTFDAYTFDGEEVLIGADVSGLRQAVKRARTRSDDILRLFVHDNEVQTQVERNTDVGPMHFEQNVLTLDPDSIREAPHTIRPADIDGHDYERYEIPMDAFESALNYITDEYNHVLIQDHNGELTFSSREAGVGNVEEPSAVRFSEVPGPEEPVLVSGDYMTDALAGIKKTGADTVHFSVAGEVPVFLQAEKMVDGDTALSVNYGVAPRITTE